ncbi:MAG TPA: RnfH family protein [Usitatibacteraceae bacterium]|nr:RnfH family protein [Usitatibacteraceae bacterium]
MSRPEAIRVRWVALGETQERLASLPPGTTLAQALARLQMEPLPARVAVAVWGKLRKPDYVLREGDRIELLEPLRIDPKSARRAKAAAR